MNAPQLEKKRISFHTFFFLHRWMSQAFVTLTFFKIQLCQVTSSHQASVASRSGRTHRTLLPSPPGLKYAQVNGGSIKQRPGTLSTSCPLVVEMSSNQVMLLSHSEALIGDLLSLLLVLSVLLHISHSLFTSQGHPNVARGRLCFFFPHQGNW